MTTLLSKSNFFTIIALLIVSAAHSQTRKIEEDDGIIKVDGQPYAKISKIYAGFPGFNHFSIKSLSNVELIFMKGYDKVTGRKWDEKAKKYRDVTSTFYDIKFVGSGGMVTVNDWLSQKDAMKIVVEYSLIKDNAIDPASEAKYIRTFRGYSPPKPKGPIVINGDLITQDENVLAKFLIKNSTSASSEEIMVISIYSTNGEKIASAEAPIVNALEWTVQTISDGKTTSILYSSPEEKEKLFKWLLDKGYLK